MLVHVQISCHVTPALWFKGLDKKVLDIDIQGPKALSQCIDSKSISPLWLTEISTLSSLQILWRNTSNDTSISNWHIGYIWLHTAASHGFRPGHQATSIATRIATGLSVWMCSPGPKGAYARGMPNASFYIFLPMALPCGSDINVFSNSQNRCWLFKTGASKITSWWKRKERRNLPRNRSMAWRSAVAFWKHRREHVARGRPLAYLQGGWILWVFYFTKKQSDRHMYDLSQHADNSGCFAGDTPFAKVAKVTLMESMTKLLDTSRFCCNWATSEKVTKILGQGYDQLDACLWHPSLRTTRRMLRTIQPFRCGFLGQSWNF